MARKPDVAKVLRLAADPTVTEVALQGVPELAESELEELAGILITRNDLRVVNLCGQLVRPYGLRVIIPALKSSAGCLTFLSLKNNLLGNLTPDWIRCDGLDTTTTDMLCDLLRGAHNLQTLILSDNGLGSSALVRILSAVQGLPHLTRLELDHTDCTDEAIEAVASVLRTSTALTELNLSNNNMAHRCQALGDALQQNRTLRVLSLTDCAMDPVAVRSVARSVRDHPCLRLLQLDREMELNEACSELGNMLLHNSVLQELSLAQNWISQAGFDRIADALACNVALMSLDLSSITLNLHMLKRLNRALESNYMLVIIEGIADYLDQAVGREIMRQLQRNARLRQRAEGRWRRTVWHALHSFSPLPTELIQAHILPLLPPPEWPHWDLQAAAGAERCADTLEACRRQRRQAGLDSAPGSAKRVELQAGQYVAAASAAATSARTDEIAAAAGADAKSAAAGVTSTTGTGRNVAAAASTASTASSDRKRGGADRQ